MNFFLSFFCLFNVIFTSLVPHTIPAANMPTGIALPTNLTGVRVLIIGGNGGIGNATAFEFYNRGASVTITTTDRDNVDASPFRVMKLEYGRGKRNVEKFVDRYLEHVGFPDVLVDIGLTYFTGLMMDFTRDEMEYATRMYITDPLLLYREFLKHNNVSKPFNISIALSTVSFGAAGSFSGLYAAGKMAKKDFVRDFALYEGPKYYPNVRISGIACSYVDTRIVVDGYNPSADRGDAFQIQFVEVVTGLNSALGLPPVTVALAHLEAITTLTKENNSIYLVPTSPSGRVTSEILYNVYVSDNTTEFTKDNYAFYSLVGLNISSYL